MGKVHLIGNAHIDLVWFWRWQEGYSEVLASFRSALDRLSEFEEFIFTCAGASYYQYVEETDPEMFEEIRRRVAEGRWVIVGGWMLQPDCNSPCGESFARHALYAQNYFLEKFGITAKTGYSVDAFGHAATLPQILKKSGLDAYVYLRPSKDEEMQYPFSDRTFLWTGPDGTKVPAYRIKDNYELDPFEQPAERAREHRQMSRELEDQPVMCFYGVGNHGGGPTIANILALRKLQKEEPEGEYLFSSPNRFFQQLDQSRLPAYQGDLHHHASGCYSVTMKLKELNRKSEAELLSAEKAGIMAVMAEVKNRTENLKDAWIPTLLNQFHDVACGCCVRSGIEDATHSYGHSINAAALAENRALQAIAWNIDTSKQNPVVLDKQYFRMWESQDKGTPVVVFNTHAFPVKAPVSFGALVKSVEDDDGNAVPMQVVRAQQTDRAGDNWQSQILAEVPAMGWRLYWGYRNREPAASNLPDWDGMVLENEALRIELSQDLYIQRIYDKKNGREMLAGKLMPTVLDDKESDTWSHGIFLYDRTEGVFSDARMVYRQNGPVCQQVRIAYSYGKSQLIMDICLYHKGNALDISCTVNWQEHQKVLKLCIPTTLERGTDTAAAPYGFSVRKADGKEQPMHKWVMIQDGGYGIGIATDTRNAYDCKNGVLRLTALRSAIYADHYGMRDQLCEHTDQGEHRFELSVMPVTDDLHQLCQYAEVLLKPLTVQLGTYHKGKLGAQGSMICVDAPNVLVTALKPAEDGEGYILHCYETAGKETQASISMPALGVTICDSFGPQQIRAYRIKENKVEEVDFLERPL